MRYPVRRNNLNSASHLRITLMNMHEHPTGTSWTSVIAQHCYSGRSYMLIWRNIYVHFTLTGGIIFILKDGRNIELLVTSDISLFFQVAIEMATEWEKIHTHFVDNRPRPYTEYSTPW